MAARAAPAGDRLQAIRPAHPSAGQHLGRAGPLSGASVLIGAGFIAACNSAGDEATAALVDSVLRAEGARKVHVEVFALGDNAYPRGTDRDFALCFTPSWGDSPRLIMKNIRPAPGNHEYRSEGAVPYYQYFGSHAGSSGKDCYSYDVGAWHAIVLNSEIAISAGFTSADRTAQEEWLAQDLKENGQKCTLAYWHHPRFSSGGHGSDPRLGTLWQTLYDAGAELIVNGHDHICERLLPQTPEAEADSVRGLTQITVGTGGGEFHGYGRTIVSHSASRIQGHFGVLKLTLGPGVWRSAFLDVNGSVWDQAGGECH